MTDSQPGGAALVEAVQWAAAVMTGPVATAIAVITIAMLGFAFLQGRIDARRAARTILGCFIIFGAPSIAAALAGAQDTAGPPPPAASATSVQPTHVTPVPAPYDPYAGASVPVR